MGAQAATQNDDAVRVPVEVSDGEAVAKAMEHVNGIVDKITSLVTTKSAEPTGDADDDATDDNTASDDDAATIDTSKATVKGVLAAMGLKGKAMKEAMAKLKKAGFDPDMAFPSAKAPITKSADDGDAGDDDVVMSDDDQPLTIGAVRKAAAFTPTRVKQIQEAAETLKLILEAIGVGKVPATRTPGVENHSNPSNVNNLASPKRKPVMKSADGDGGEDLATVLKSLGDALGKMDERLEAIEKARPGSNSVEDDADTTDTDSTPVEKSIWGGVL